MIRRFGFWVPLLGVALAVIVCPATAGGLAGDTPAFAPRVPISALALPAAWFDPSRLHVSTSVSVASGFGGGTNALQVTRLSYQFNAPLWMNVSVGNAWGQSSVAGRNSFFLEGLELAYRPIPSLLLHVQYRDIRSPLQYSPYSNHGFWAP